MKQRAYDYAMDVLSGRADGLAAAFTRGGLAAVEPLYRFVVGGRNSLYDRGVLTAHDLGRPTVSVGNLTTGGTGKTPVVAWLARRLREQGQVPAVLLRGYASTRATGSDEAAELRQLLRDPSRGDVPVVAHPDRVAAARSLLRDRPDVSVLLLDDGFQHRRAARRFDLVLIDATQPFGFGRVLPRGLLREPVDSLRRASAVLLTRCDLATPDSLASTLATITRANPTLPVYRSSHAFTCFGDDEPIERLRGRRVGAFCGIGNPQAFRAMLERAGADIRAFIPFPDHHPFDADDYCALDQLVRGEPLDLLLTTVKDAMRLRDVPATLPIAAVRVGLVFQGDDEARLLADVAAALPAR